MRHSVEYILYRPDLRQQGLTFIIIFFSVLLLAAFVPQVIVVIIAVPMGLLYLVLSIVGIIFFFVLWLLLSSIWMLVGLCLLPYRILDFLALRYNLKSTILLIAAICGLLGVILEK